MDERAGDVDQLARDLDEAGIPLDDLVHLLPRAPGDIGRRSQSPHVWRLDTPNQRPRILDQLARAADSFVAAVER